MNRMNNFYDRGNAPYYGAGADVSETGRLMAVVYKWMASGLALTGLVSLIVSQSPFLFSIVYNYSILFIISELGLVVYLSSRIQSMPAQRAALLFYLYSALNGATMSYIFLVYTRSSIASTFFCTAGTFGACSLYGYTTKRDLTSAGGFFIMGLFGLIIASFVNIFMHSPAITWMISYLGVFIFIGLTAYDTQKIKHVMAVDTIGMGHSKLALIGALMLYLDFINMFIFMLQIFGNRRD